MRYAWCVVVLVGCGSPGNNPDLCGNGVLDFGEACDGDDVPCESLGLGSGTAYCLIDCSRDTTECAMTERELVVRVRFNGAVYPDAPVLVSNLDGTPISTHTTDAQGEVRTRVPTSVLVSSKHTKQNGNVDVVSWNSDDTEVAFNFLEPTGTPTSVGSIRATWANPPQGTTTIRVSNGCTIGTASVSSPNPLTTSATTACETGTNQVSLYAEALDGTGVPLGYKYVPSVAVSTASPTDVLVDTWDTAFTPMEATVTSVPAGTADLAFFFRTGVGPVIHHNPTGFLIPTPVAGQSYTRARPMANASFVTYAAVSVVLDDSRGCARIQPSPGPFTFTGAEFPTVLANVAIDTSRAGQPGLSFTAGTPSGTPDTMSAWMYFSSPTNDFMTWNINGPTTMTSPIRLPQIPDDPRWTDVLPSAWTQIVSSSRVTLFDYEGITNHNQVAAGVSTTPTTGMTCSSSCFAQ